MAGSGIKFTWPKAAKDKLRDMAGAALTRAMEGFGEYKVSRIQRSFLARGMSEPGMPPGRRSTHLQRSINWRWVGKTMQIGTGLIYAALQQFGGTIRMRDKALTVPIDPMAEGKRARDFAGLIYLPSGGGPSGHCLGLLALPAKGKRSEPRALFALMSEVTVPARPYLYFDTEDQTKMLGLLSEEWKGAA
jgi:phage gpG-like protein